MPSLSDFSKRMKKLALMVQQNSTAITREAALAVDQALVTSTPVDTGRARSNWNVSINVSGDQIRDAFHPGEKGSTGSDNTRAQLAEARSVIESYTKGDIHIVNNLPYISVLNDGSSAQAPAGFVEAAVQVGNDAVRKGRVLG